MYLFFGRREHEVVLGVGQANHHALHPVLAPSRQHTEEVDTKGSSQLGSAADQVQLLQQGKVQARAPQPVMQAPPPPPCHNMPYLRLIHHCMDQHFTRQSAQYKWLVLLAKQLVLLDQIPRSTYD